MLRRANRYQNRVVDTRLFSPYNWSTLSSCVFHSRFLLLLEEIWASAELVFCDHLLLFQYLYGLLGLTGDENFWQHLLFRWDRFLLPQRWSWWFHHHWSSKFGQFGGRFWWPWKIMKVLKRSLKSVLTSVGRCDWVTPVVHHYTHRWILAVLLILHSEKLNFEI